jgi:hypothetical protein
VISKTQSALLIIGHGSTVNPDSSAPTLAHTSEMFVIPSEVEESLTSIGSRKK